MKFLFPTFLFALLAIAIPIIIHLFSFRRFKTVYFSNVGLLKDIKKESKKKSRLKQILILIARILTIVFLVFAFSQPFIPSNIEAKKLPNQIVAVYIDNSFSMNALSERGQLLELARNKALEICLAHPAGTKFRIFTNDLEPKHQHIFTKEQFIQQVSEIKTSPAVVPVSMIYNRFSFQNSESIENTDKTLYLISDFQRSVTDVENFNETNIYSHLIPLKPNEIANIYIDTCWIEVPAHRLNQQETILVKIKNSSNQNYQNLPLKLYLNDSIKSITNFSVSAQNEIIAELKYTNNSSGSQRGKIEISDYPFTHDNNWYISYFVEPNLSALAIFNKNPDSKEGLEYIKALFENDDYIQLDEMNIQNLQISHFGSYNTIFLINPDNFSSGLINELQNVVDKGTSVVLFPNSQDNPLINNTLLSKFGANLVIGTDSGKQKISGVDFDNRFFDNVFRKREDNAILPEINSHLKFEENSRTEETKLLWFQNNDKALSVLNYKNGKIWTFGFPLEKKNEAFARDILFVPTLYNIVLNSLPIQKIAFVVSKNTFFDFTQNTNAGLGSLIEIENLANGNKFIPNKSISERGTRIEFADQIFEAGHYLIKNESEIISTLAFNYNRNESDLTYFNSTELEEKIKISQLKNTSVVQNANANISEIFNEIQNGKQLWKQCILFALFFILAEVLVSRFMK